MLLVEGVMLTNEPSCKLRSLDTYTGAGNLVKIVQPMQVASANVNTHVDEASIPTSESEWFPRPHSKTTTTA